LKLGKGRYRLGESKLQVGRREAKLFLGYLLYLLGGIGSNEIDERKVRGGDIIYHQQENSTPNDRAHESVY